MSITGRGGIQVSQEEVCIKVVYGTGQQIGYYKEKHMTYCMAEFNLRIQIMLESVNI